MNDIIIEKILLSDYHGLRDRLSSLCILSIQKLPFLSSFLRYAASYCEISWYFFNTFPYFLLTAWSYSFLTFSASSSFFSNLIIKTFTCVFIFSSKISLCDAYSFIFWMSYYRNRSLSLMWMEEAYSAALRKVSEWRRAYLMICISFWAVYSKCLRCYVGGVLSITFCLEISCLNLSNPLLLSFLC